MPAFNKQLLEVEAKKYGFNRDTFEKVVRLRRILEYINGDIDLDYSPNDEKTDMEEARERIKTMLLDYMEHFEAKDYRPEMLFEEPEIIERIKKHPMALWRCR